MQVQEDEMRGGFQEGALPAPCPHALSASSASWVHASPLCPLLSQQFGSGMP